jgi:DnaJ-class molecular chaperone
MQIHECARCEGCGYITGSLRWEIPWSRWADAKDPQHHDGVLEAQPCPDCGGTGALIRMDDVAAVEPGLPSRRGLHRQPSYAEHVENVLHFQHVLKY